MNNSNIWARRLTALSLAFGALAANNAMADEAITETPPLLITTGAEPLPTKEVASSYSIVTAEDIATYQYHDVVDALQSVPGLQVVRSGGAGALTSVFTRGSNSNQTLVMVNGLPINDPSSPTGAANLGNIPLDNVERIEVVRGPQSALYGSQAIGGVINIITKTGSETALSTAKVEVGTLGTINTSASTGGSFGGTTYFLSAARNATDGSDITPARLRGAEGDEDDANENYNLSGNFGFKISDNLETNAFVQYTKANTDIDDSGSDALFNNTYQNRNNQTKASTLLLGGDIKGSFFNNVWRPKLTLGLTRSTSDSFDVVAPNDSIYSYTVGASGETKKVEFSNAVDVTENNLVTFGATYQRDEFRANGSRDFTGGFLIFPDSDANTHTYGVYLGDHITLGESFFLTLNGRYDMPSDFDNRFSYTIAPGYYIAETDTRLTASYGTGFKAPSLYQLYGYDPNSFGNFYIGNPDLKPETSKGWDAGIEQGFLDGKLRTGVTWFQSDIKDAISIVYIGFDSTAMNTDKLKTKGVETFIAFDPLDNVTTRIDYTYTQVNSDSYTTTMTRRPRHKIGFTADWRPFDGTTLSTNVQWVDPGRDISRDGFVPYYVYPSDYTIVNIAASQELTKWLTLTAGVNNLLDQDYEPAHGFEAAGIEALAGLAVTF
jgi:vitamin B12 transporter